jgi:hypothetical protein
MHRGDVEGGRNISLRGAALAEVGERNLFDCKEKVRVRVGVREGARGKGEKRNPLISLRGAALPEVVERHVKNAVNNYYCTLCLRARTGSPLYTSLPPSPPPLYCVPPPLYCFPTHHLHCSAAPLSGTFAAYPTPAAWGYCVPSVLFIYTIPCPLLYCATPHLLPFGELRRVSDACRVG